MKRTAVLAWVVLLPIVLFSVTPAFGQLLDPTTLTKYIDPLPQPPVRTPDGMHNGKPLYNVYLSAVKQKMHSELDSTPIFAFDGVTPGPTFLVPMGQPVAVRYVNDLPTDHMFHVDTTIHVMAGQGWGQSSRFVSHLHGGDVEAVYDGWCMDFIYPGQETTYIYPNSQPGATLWYHDHSCGVTRLNAYGGLAGFYIIDDPREKRLNMPDGPYMLGIAVQDRTFYENGELYYPYEWEPEFFGDVSLVNGVVWPKLEVEPRKYRIRFLNGCNDRFLNMKLLEADEEGNVDSDSMPGPAFYMVGSEQGLLNNTLILNDPGVVNSPRMLVDPGDRRDFIIDFAEQQGKYFLMHNNARVPFKGVGNPAEDDVPLPELFLVHVKDTSVVDPYSIPMQPGHVETPKPAQAKYTRPVELAEMMDMGGDPMMMLLNGLHFMDPTTDFPVYNTTEIWQFINTTEDVHPMHIHLVNWQILERRPFDVDQYMLDQTIVYTGDPVPPEPQEMGRRDMANAWPGYVTTVVTSKFNRLGTFVYHCHILAHEENDMMRPYEVVLPNQEGGGMMASGLEPLQPVLSVRGPEPFRNRATIAYSAGIEQRVRLSVFNSLGQEVKTLVDGAVNRGIHSAVWDGTNNAGEQVAAGAYFYKLQTPKSSQTARTTLLR
ncbi:multicopper oxidase domain-containing protein [candidate division WOR-3 bacterium]|nr:multicopper oxidase domain-containing protein [candidate division WOR-3 bacterium]